MSIYASDAIATVLDPARVDCHPALMQDAWCRLKESRGQPVRRIHLLQPAHVIRADASAVPDVDPQAELRMRVSARVQARRAFLEDQRSADRPEAS